MLCKHVSCMVLEICHVVVYAKTSLLRTEKPVLDEPAGGVKTVARHRGGVKWFVYRVSDERTS